MSAGTTVPTFDPKSPLPEVCQHSDLQTQITNLLAKDLFFIGGNPKSGTTWLQVMLNAHPEISCKGDGHFIDHFTPLLQSALNAHNRLVSVKNGSIFREFVPFPCFDRDHLAYLLRSAIALVLLRSDGSRQARAIGEKTPNNVVYFPQLEALFPTAKFLHVVRDGRDCAVSTWFHNLRTNPDELKRRHASFEHFAEEIARNWTAWVGRGLAFGAAHPDRCMIVRYEDLSVHPHDTLRDALRFLGVSATTTVLRQCMAEAAFEKMSGGRRPGIEDRSSFLRQGKPGNWREHFTPEADQSFLAIAGELMTQLGYQH